MLLKNLLFPSFLAKVANADFFEGKEGFWIYEWQDSGTSGTPGHPDAPTTDVYTLITSG